MDFQFCKKGYSRSGLGGGKNEVTISTFLTRGKKQRLKNFVVEKTW